MRFHRQFGMERFVFHKLLQALKCQTGLQDMKHVSAEEQLAIFLWIACTGMSNAEMQEHFQRSGETISKYVLGNFSLLSHDCVHLDSISQQRAFHRILNMLVSKQFYDFYVTLPSPDKTPPEISENPKFFPWFEGCLRAIDGSLLNAFVTAGDMSRYRN